MSILKLFEYTFSTLGFAEEAIEKDNVDKAHEKHTEKVDDEFCPHSEYDKPTVNDELETVSY